MEQTRFMGDKILNFFKHLSVIKRVLLGIITLLVIGYIFCLPRHLFHVPYSTVVTDRNGELLGARIASDGQWRFPPRKTTPEKIRQCLITFEDKNFYYHWGVDPLSIGRATYQNLKNKRIVSGGSTLTMQTIRLARHESRTFGEKVIEMILATRLEFRASKEEILSMYVSHAPLGGNVVGCSILALFRSLHRGFIMGRIRHARRPAQCPRHHSFVERTKNTTCQTKPSPETTS